MITGDVSTIRIKIEVSDCEFQAGQPEVTWTEIETHGRKLLNQYFDFWKKYKKCTLPYPIQEISDSVPTAEYIINLHNYFLRLDELESLLKFSREMLKVTEGSIITHISVPTIESLEDLWKMFNTSQLTEIFTALLEDKLVERFLLSTLKLKVTVLEEEYSQIKRRFSKQALKVKTVEFELSAQHPANSTSPMIECSETEVLNVTTMSEDGRTEVASSSTANTQETPTAPENEIGLSDTQPSDVFVAKCE